MCGAYQTVPLSKQYCDVLIQFHNTVVILNFGRVLAFENTFDYNAVVIATGEKQRTETLQVVNLELRL